MRRIGSTSLLLVSALALAACSAGGGSSGERTSTTVVSTSSTSSTSTTSKPSTGPTRAAYSFAFADTMELIDHRDHCLAGHAVDAVGLDRLHEADITPEEFAGKPILDRLDLDAAELAALKADLTEAIDTCGNAKKLATDYLSDDDPKWDMRSLAPCVAEPLAPLLVQIVLDGWTGDRSKSLLDATNDAISLADGGCPELQLETVERAAREHGVTLTGAQRACIMLAYTGLAEEHRVLGDDDDAGVAHECLEQ